MNKFMVLALLAVLSSGCMRWKDPGQTTADALNRLQNRPIRTRVTLSSGERITYKSARVFGDSIKEGKLRAGSFLLRPELLLDGGGKPMPTHDVRKVEFWEIDWGLTALGAAGVIGVLAYVFANAAFL